MNNLKIHQKSASVFVMEMEATEKGPNGLMMFFLFLFFF